MDTLKKWIKDNKSEIIIILGAITTVFTSFQALDPKYATVTTVATVVVAVIVQVLKEGFTENSINLLSKAIFIIIENLKEEEKKEAVMSASVNESEEIAEAEQLTVEDIKELLKAELLK